MILTLISTTAMSGTETNITSGIDSDYKEYWFVFTDVEPATDGSLLQFQGSIDAGSNYNVAKTTSWFYSYHSYAIDGLVAVEYNASFDLAQGTGDQILTNNIGNDNDQSASGSLFIYNPSSTTFVKHFMAVSNSSHASDLTLQGFIAGYGNTTSAVTGVQFKMNTDEIQGGKIKLYGLKDSA